jgi:hypothetical protein
MIARILCAVVAAGFLFSATGPASAAGEPKTKAACEKMKGMAWDDATKKCAKKPA